MKRVLAFDIGASSGRAIIGEYKNGKIYMNEIHRFSNDPVIVCGHTYWDILKIFNEIKIALKKAGDIDSIGIDTWGVDFGLIDRYGQLMSNPYHYRDKRNDITNKLNIYKRSGIQYMQFNTVYQLIKSDLSKVNKMLLIPDLLAYFLTGKMRMEYTNASTTNLLNAYSHEIDNEILISAGINNKIFAEMIKPGEVYGMLSNEICNELNIKPVPVVAVGSHDTASAIASLPISEIYDSVYLSSGTWSLLGTISKQPIISDLSEKYNFTNELSVNFDIRFLKNICGLWMIQELRREYNIDYPTLSTEAKKCDPFRYIIDPDCFNSIGNMSYRISKAVEKDLSMGEAARCVYDSLCLKYKSTLKKLELITKIKYNKLYMFGGGIKDEFLCQNIADVLGIPVVTTSSEATALGNIAVQICTNISDISDLMLNSIKTKIYLPNTDLYLNNI